MRVRDRIRLLVWINRQRVRMGLWPLFRLPKGYRWQGGDRCPLAQALPGTYFYGGDRISCADVGGGKGTLDVPPVACEFIRAFDAGKLPKLILHGTPK